MLKTSPLIQTIVQFLLTLVSIAYLLTNQLSYIDVALILLGYVLVSGYGQSVFFHRYWSHKSFKTYKMIEYIGTILGCLACKGSPITWCSVHRQHHKYSDTDLDAHYPGNGILRLFIPVLNKDYNKINPMIVRDLLKDKFQLFLFNYYNPIILGTALVLSIISVHYMIILWVIPATLNVWMLAIMDLLTHSRGYQNYDCGDNSRNNWIASIFYWGEGWNNNHHYTPSDYNFKKKWYEFDLGKHMADLIRIP